MSDPEFPDDDLTGDEVYQPQGDDTDVTDDAGLLDPLDTLDDRGIDPAIDEGWSPPERPLEVDRTGTTAAEQREGESLDQRLAEEVPDEPDPRAEDDGIGDAADAEGEPVDPEAGDERSGRLIGDDEGVPRPPGSGVEDLTASDAGIAGGAASAEEAAVHTVEDPEQEPDRDEEP